MPPNKSAELPVEVQKIIDAKVAEALAAQTKALKKPKGWLIRSPIYGTADAAKVPLDELAVHRHNIVDASGKSREVMGTVQLVNGQGYTDNEDFANFIAQYWGPDGYKVTRVNADNSTAPLIAKAQELARIVDGVGEATLTEPAAV